MKVLNQIEYDDWKGKNTDPYGGECFRYAEAWAELLEAKLAQGLALADFASAASHEADTSGITGFMHGMALGILAKCWVHGEELRRWHNTFSQLNNEGEKANESGGVLNPAVLTVIR